MVGAILEGENDGGVRSSRHRLISLCVLLTILAMAAPAAFGAERVAVTAATANIRSGPGVKFDQLWQAERYYPFIVLEKRNEWLKVKDFEGDEGWLHQSLIGKLETVITSANQCNIRKGPGTGHAVAFTVDKGIPFKVIQRKGSWLAVEHDDGDRGWILDTLVW